MTNVAVIPARGGSKGLKRKNIMNLCGKPLIAYSIETALKAELIDRVIVTTDDVEIAEVARDAGAEVPFLRPKEMATDHSSVMDGVLYTVQNLLGHDADHSLLTIMFPTSPFRTAPMLDMVINKILNHGFSFAVAIKQLSHPMPNSVLCKENGSGFVHFDLEENLFRSYGNFSVSRNIYRSNRTYCHMLSPVETIDIDTLEDFLLAEEVIENGLYDFDAPCRENESFVTMEAIA